MEELFKETAARIAISVELAAALLIAYGAVEAIVSLFIPKRRPEHAPPFHKRRQIFLIRHVAVA